jgi:Fe-S cluster assembly protein SufD
MSAAAPIDQLEAVGLPTKRDEAWRYAPHRLLGELTFGASVAAEVALDLADRLPVLDGPRIVVVNGVVDPSLSDLSAPDGVTLTTLADAVARGSELTRAHVALEHGPADAFMALNAAHGTDGAVISVGDGVTVAAPIHVIDIAAPNVTANTSCTGVVIDVGAGSSVTIVESRIGVGTEVGGSNVRTTITVGDDATVEHIVLQDLPSEQVHLGRIDVAQGARSTVHIRSFNLGASYGRLAYHVELNGPEALADLSGLYFGVGDQVLDQQITVVHRAKDCASRQLFRGVLDDGSTGVFNGGIDVCPGADGTDAEQSNDNLLLSNRAEANTQPRLEILADEVACKHGATVGQLDDQALYYLRTRGINAEAARRLLINGFADEVVDDVSIDAVRNWITHRLGHDHD